MHDELAGSDKVEVDSTVSKLQAKVVILRQDERNYLPLFPIDQASPIGASSRGAVTR